MGNSVPLSFGYVGLRMADPDPDRGAASPGGSRRNGSAGKPAPSSPEAEDADALKILLIEQQAGDAQLMQVDLSEALAGQEISVRHVRDLQEASLHLSRERVDLILLDLNLPESHVQDNLERIQEIASGTPVIVLTGIGGEASAIRAIESGAQDYLVKGLGDRATMVRTIQYSIERHRLQKQLDTATEELRATQEKLESLACADPVTSGLNVRGLQRAFQRELQWCRRMGSDLCALVIDLDDFRRINSSLGHAVGDIVLAETSRLLEETLRATDHVGRLGGDEFLVLLPQTRPAEARRVAEKVRASLSRLPIVLSSGTVQFTASVAVLTVSSATQTLDELLAQSRRMLDRARTAGHNRLSLETGMEADASDAYSLISRGDRFHVALQPIFRLQDESKVGYELLCRSTIQGYEQPDHFFGLSMEANILTLVDQACFKSCLAASRRVGDDLTCHINLFPSTLLGVPAASILEALPDRRPPASYCLEISEKQIIGSPSYLSGPVQELRSAGVRIAIDDVGFGHSCLESLILLQPDVLKIDRACVKGIAESVALSRSLVRLLKMAHSLEADVVAEGIETREDLERLKELGVPYGQGFLWGKPA
ncbi:MAG: EAL domain-containing protein [Nitrospirae bacterium]|nr:EAL domain-containing protein [Nitrospirota bacterium]